MTMTDPVADMLTRVRNANTAYLDEIAGRGHPQA
jgi:ribosomal protein S8